MPILIPITSWNGTLTTIGGYLNITKLGEVIIKNPNNATIYNSELWAYAQYSLY